MTRRKKILILALLACVILGGAALAARQLKLWPFSRANNTTTPAQQPEAINYSKPTSDQTQAGNAIKEQVANQAAKSTNTDTQPTTSSNSVGMDITAINKTTDTLMVRVLIHKVTSSGTCDLSMSGPGGATYTASAKVQAMASSSTCQGFNVLTSGLAHGSWTVTIKFSDGTDSGTVSKGVDL